MRAHSFVQEDWNSASSAVIVTVQRNYIQFVLHKWNGKEIHYVLDNFSFFQTINFASFSALFVRFSALFRWCVSLKMRIRMPDVPANRCLLSILFVLWNGKMCLCFFENFGMEYQIRPNSKNVQRQQQWKSNSIQKWLDLIFGPTILNGISSKDFVLFFPFL